MQSIARLSGILAFLIFTLTGNCHGQFDSLGGPSFGASPKMLGMGGAFTGLAEGSGLIFSNPAGVKKVPQGFAETIFRLNAKDERFIAFSYLNPGSHDDFAGGLSVVLSKDSTNAEKPVKHIAMMYTMGQTLPSSFRGRDLHWGINIKYHHQELQTIAGGIDHEFDLDVGLLTGINERTQIGLAGINMFQPSFSLGETSKPEPRIVILGIAHRLNPGLLATCDIWDIEDHTADLTHGSGLTARLGLEQMITEKLALRGGLLDGRLTLGFGYKSGNKVRFEYGFADLKNAADIHMASMRLAF